MEKPADSREIFTLASECCELFQICACADQERPRTPSKGQRDVASLCKDFEAWCFNLGVFAAPTASLDQTLRYSDEIRGFVTQLLSILHRNLKFIKKDLPKSTISQPSQENEDVVEKLQGSTEEALRAISAVLQRLDRLGATIRKYSASSLSSRVKAFAEQDNDEYYRLLTKNMVTFKYPTAPPSLHVQLAGSMAYRRQRLRYIRQHHQKTAPKDHQDLRPRKRNEKGLFDSKPTKLGMNQYTPKDRAAALPSQVVYRPKGSIAKDIETTPSTTAWTLRPTSSFMERVRHDGSNSVISSSKTSTTRMAGHLDDYPEPPTRDQWSHDPKCPTCWRQLMESELKGTEWGRHVDTDCEPYVCISEECRQPPQFFSDLALWENHMRNQHSTKWTQLVHEPTVWICDVDHDDEEFQDHESFQGHLDQAHADLSEADREAITTLSETPMVRPKHTCPLCGCDPTAQQENRSETSPSTQQDNDNDQLTKLAKHIAGHLRCLAFHTLDHLDSDHESVSDTSKHTRHPRATSRSRPASELKDLDGVSCEFSDDDDIRSVSTFDELKTRQGGDLVDENDATSRIISIPPLFKEDWVGIQELKPDEEDPILNNLMAYSRWDRAYDNLKKTKPLLVENFEILLSKELAKDAERNSKPIVNQFRGVDIHTRRALLDDALRKLQDRIHHKYRAKNVTRLMLGWIGESVRELRRASLPLVGFCLILATLANLGVKEEFDLTRLARSLSKLPNCFAIGHRLNTRKWTSPEANAEILVRVEKQTLQQFQNMLEFQLRVLNPPDEAGGLFQEDYEPEIHFDVPYLMVSDGYDKPPACLEDVAWTESTIFAAISGLSPAKRAYSSADERNLRRLHRVLKLDPRKVKDQIEAISGGLLKDSYRWVLDDEQFHQFQNDPGTRLLWVSGPPGIGKTMLLCGLVDELSVKSTALSYFFCRASDSHLNSGVAVLRGLLFLLAYERPSLISAYHLLESQLLEDAFTWEPLAKLVLPMLADPLLEGVVLVVDAIDECLTNQDSLIEFINMPSHVKWIISSRGLPNIKDAWNGRIHVTLQLESRGYEMFNAIEAYMQHKLGNLAKEKNLDPTTSATLHNILVQKAEGNFLLANLFIQQLVQMEPSAMIQGVSQLPSSLDHLYEKFFMSILKSSHLSLCQRVLAIAVVVFRPVTLEELKNLDPELQRVNEGFFAELVSACYCFLTLQEGTIYFVHHSAKEFLMYNAMSPAMPSGITEQHHVIFLASIECLVTTLHEDIYNLLDPGVRTDEVSRRDPDPLLAVRYSCTNWVVHLELVDVESTLHEHFWESGGVLHTFLKEHLLHWIEALSLLGGLSEALEALGNLLLLRDSILSTDVFRLIEDACTFIFYHTETIANFPLQVYASALIFSPNQSMVKQLFLHQTATWITSPPVIRGDWKSQAIESHDSRLLSMAWSWDTHRVVAGSHDDTITMWDTNADVCIRKISNYGSSAYLVAFSPDGRLFASASSNGLIKVWDTQTCRCRIRFFQNAGTANQVVFSADGQILAAAFSDGSINIWDLGAGLSSQVLNRGGRPTLTFALSANGRMLASGWSNGLIGLWDLATGQLTRKLERHGDSVTSIALSADGKQLASSSLNGTLRIWDTMTGSLLHVVEVKRTIRHLSFDPTASNCLSTDMGRLEISPSGEASFTGYGLSADNRWILKDGKRLLRIPWECPPESPGRPVVRGSMAGLVRNSGDILTMRLR